MLHIKNVGLVLVLVMRLAGIGVAGQPVSLAQEDAVAVYGYTYQQPDGNRFVVGQGSLPDAVPLDITLDGAPQWVVAAPQGEALIWAVVLDDGAVQAFRVENGTANEIAITPDRVPQGMPPLLAVAAESVSLVVSPDSIDASPLTHPVVIDDAGTLAIIAANGDLVLWREGAERGRLALDALPDARILQDGAGHLLIATQPSVAYDHGVLGDALEPRAVALLKVEGDDLVATVIDLPGTETPVFEGIAPIWADLDGDGERDVIMTWSDRAAGARIAVNGIEGPAIGRGYRWRHQIAVAPFGVNGELELVDVLTPHIGGVVEFYRFDGAALDIVASQGGFTSHSIGSRNLDMAAAGDFNGDGQVELLLPAQDLTTLGGIQRTENGAVNSYNVEIGGRVVTNLGAVTLPDGRIAVGVGRSDGVLRLWLPG